MQTKTYEKIFGFDKNECENVVKELCSVKGPNYSEITFVSVDGYCNIVQEFDCGNGFEVYTSVKENSVEAAQKALGLKFPNTLTDLQQLVADEIQKEMAESDTGHGPSFDDLLKTTGIEMNQLKGVLGSLVVDGIVGIDKDGSTDLYFID